MLSVEIAGPFAEGLILPRSKTWKI